LVAFLSPAGAPLRFPLFLLLDFHSRNSFFCSSESFWNSEYLW
jgi:hypothetical protein